MIVCIYIFFFLFLFLTMMTNKTYFFFSTKKIILINYVVDTYLVFSFASSPVYSGSASGYEYYTPAYAVHAT